MPKSQTLFVAIFIFAMAHGSQAAPITLDSTATGSISRFVSCLPVACVFESYTSTNPLETVGSSSTIGFPAGRPATTESSSRGYAIFDVSTLTAAVVGAKIELNLQYTTAADSQFSIRALSSSAADELATNPVGTQEGSFSAFDPASTTPLFGELLSQYGTLASGAEVALFAQSGPFAGIFEIELNEVAVDLINAASGLFALGLNWSSNHPAQGLSRADAISFNGAPRLILNTGSASVPVPSSLWLLGAAFALLIRPKNV